VPTPSTGAKAAARATGAPPSRATTAHSGVLPAADSAKAHATASSDSGAQTGSSAWTRWGSAAKSGKPGSAVVVTSSSVVTGTPGPPG